MGAGTSPADRAASESGPAAEGAGAPAEPETPDARTGSTVADTSASGTSASDTSASDTSASGTSASGTSASGTSASGTSASGTSASDTSASDTSASDTSASDTSTSDTSTSDTDISGTDVSAGTRRGRRFSLTRDTARPEGGGRAAGGDAPAPARQWPLLAVLCTAAAGLLIIAADPFEQAFRIGTILIGMGLVGGAVLRLVVPSVGMLAVRSRFTDLVTYGLLGILIVMLSLMAQPKPWLDIPFLEDAVHFTIR